MRQNAKVEQMYKAVRKFEDLGTGRDYLKVLLGDTDDARSATFYFVGNISRNWPSWKHISIKVDNQTKSFDTAEQTIDGHSAHFFPWNELTEHLWRLQNQQQKLLRWYDDNTGSRDSVGMAELIVEETGSAYRVENYPGLERANLRPIQIEIMKLSLAVLRRLNSLVNAGTDNNLPSARAE